MEPGSWIVPDTVLGFFHVVLASWAAPGVVGDSAGVSDSVGGDDSMVVDSMVVGSMVVGSMLGCAGGVPSSLISSVSKSLSYDALNWW